MKGVEGMKEEGEVGGGGQGTSDDGPGGRPIFTTHEKL